MSFTSEEEDRIREIFDEQLERFIKYQLRAFEPVTQTENTPQHPLAALPKEISDQLEATVGVSNEYVIKTVSYLKPELFDKAHKHFLELGGKYHKATNDSHPYWTVPK